MKKKHAISHLPHVEALHESSSSQLLGGFLSVFEDHVKGQNASSVANNCRPGSGNGCCVNTKAGNCVTGCQIQL